MGHTSRANPFQGWLSLPGRRLGKSAFIGIASTAVAFWVTYGLTHVLGETNLILLIAAVAFSCWLDGWRAGAFSALSSLLAVALLLPPVFTLTIDSIADLALLGVFALTALCVCLVGYISDRRALRLRTVEKRSEMSEGWIEAAQKEVALWTWELNLENAQLKWRNPYGDIASEEFRSYDIWYQAVHPADRAHFAESMQAARQSGVFQIKYRAYTTRGLHRLASRGIVLQEMETAPRLLVGITVDLDCERAPAPPARRTHLDDSQLVLSLIEINDLLAEVEQQTSPGGEACLKLAQARDRIAKLLIADSAPSLSD